MLFSVWLPKCIINNCLIIWKAFLYFLCFSVSISKFQKGNECGEPTKYLDKQLDTKYLKKAVFKDQDKVAYKCVQGYSQSEGSRFSHCKKGHWTTLTMKCQSKMNPFIYVSKIYLNHLLHPILSYFLIYSHREKVQCAGWHREWPIHSRWTVVRWYSHCYVQHRVLKAHFDSLCLKSTRKHANMRINRASEEGWISLDVVKHHIYLFNTFFSTLF